MKIYILGEKIYNMQVPTFVGFHNKGNKHDETVISKKSFKS